MLQEGRKEILSISFKKQYKAFINRIQYEKRDIKRLPFNEKGRRFNSSIQFSFISSIPSSTNTWHHEADLQKSLVLFRYIY